MSDVKMSNETQTSKSGKVRACIGILPWVICAVSALFYAYEYILRISPNVMSTQLMQYYDINGIALGNLSAFYYYAYTPMQLPVGVLMDRFGPRRLLTVACAFCAVGSYLFASSHFLSVAGLGRFLVGFGSAFAFVGVLKLATIWLPPDKFAAISGFTSALGAVGAVFGEISMTRLVEDIGWRQTVTITAAAGVILAVVIAFVVKDGKHREVSEGSHEPLDIPRICLGFWQILKNKHIWLNGIIGCLLYLPASAFAELWGKGYLQGAHHLSNTSAAAGISLVFLGFAIGGPLFGWWSDHIGKRKPPMILGSIFAAILVTLVLYIPNLPTQVLYVLLFFFGMSFGCQIIVFPIGRELSPSNLAGTALAVTNMLVMLGGVIFQPAIGGFLDFGWDGTLVNNVHVYSALDYRYSLSVIPGLLILAAILVNFIKETNATVLDNAV